MGVGGKPYVKINRSVQIEKDKFSLGSQAVKK